MLSNSATKILYDYFPLKQSVETIKKNEPLLPEPILKQIRAKTQNNQLILTDVQIGDLHTGKIVPSSQAAEYILLIQESNQEWNLATLKKSFGLTAREAEILMWVSRGKTNKEVGLILETSPRTVNKHLEHIFEKLGVPTRTAAVAKVLKK